MAHGTAARRDKIAEFPWANDSLLTMEVMSAIRFRLREPHRTSAASGARPGTATRYCADPYCANPYCAESYCAESYCAV